MQAAATSCFACFSTMRFASMRSSSFALAAEKSRPSMQNASFFAFKRSSCFASASARRAASSSFFCSARSAMALCRDLVMRRICRMSWSELHHTGWPLSSKTNSLVSLRLNCSRPGS
jgi:hypothetical protein